MKPLAPQQFTAYVGIDWADSKHDVCLQPAGSEQRGFDSFVHKVDRIEQWAQALHQRFGGPIAVALELAKGPIVYALQKYEPAVQFFRASGPRDWERTVMVIHGRHPDSFDGLVGAQHAGFHLRAVKKRLVHRDSSRARRIAGLR